MTQEVTIQIAWITRARNDALMAITSGEFVCDNDISLEHAKSLTIKAVEGLTSLLWAYKGKANIFLRAGPSLKVLKSSLPIQDADEDVWTTLVRPLGVAFAVDTSTGIRSLVK